MKKFKTHQEIKEAYDTEKYNIFYKDGDVKYKVAHLGSTIYCQDQATTNGMGIIQNFPVKNFYAIDKPVVVKPENTENINLQ